MSVVKNFAKELIIIESRPLLDPRKAELTVEEDRKYITELVDIAEELQSLTFKNRKQPTSLVFGDTEVAARVMKSTDI